MNLIFAGDRVKFLRNLTGRPRKFFYDAYGLSENTLRAYERRQSLTDKSVSLLVDIFTNEGVNVSSSWLSLGEGDLPRLSMYVNRICQDISLSVESVVVRAAQEVSGTISNSFTFVVPDDSMTPVYRIGDTVIGAKVSSSEKIVGNVCICMLAEKEYALRLVISLHEGKSSLGNLLMQEEESVYVKEFYAVVWHASPRFMEIS